MHANTLSQTDNQKLGRWNSDVADTWRQVSRARTVMWPSAVTNCLPMWLPDLSKPRNIRHTHEKRRGPLPSTGLPTLTKSSDSAVNAHIGTYRSLLMISHRLGVAKASAGHQAAFWCGTRSQACRGPSDPPPDQNKSSRPSHAWPDVICEGYCSLRPVRPTTIP
jgi:hypothetical protein